MLIIYRLDYTFLAGRSRLIGAAYLILLAVLTVFRGQTINGLTSWISIGMLSMPVFALMVLFLPIFAGILYEYRGQGKSAVVKIALWTFAPVFVQLVAGYISFPVALFILISEAVLFVIALKKDWYVVNKRAVLIGGGWSVLFSACLFCAYMYSLYL